MPNQGNNGLDALIERILATRARMLKQRSATPNARLRP